MMISNADWKNYIEKLSSLDKTAGDLMLKWVQKNGFSDSEALTDYAYALVTKYGEGSAALAAEMYDAVAEMSGKFYPPAETAPTPDYEDVAKAVNGTRRWSKNEKAVPNTVSRMVKQAGADTTLRNAIRDQAEFAWVPNGDTCAFCITLASNGWQPASNAVAKGGHAEHIHPNCDCTFAIRFDGKGGVKGYDPEKYKRMYDEAEGGNSKEKINSLRRMKYQENKDRINAQKREAYAERQKHNRFEQEDKSARPPREYEHNFVDFNKLTIGEQEREALRELYELSQHSGYEYGTVIENGIASKPETSKNPDGVKLPIDSITADHSLVLHSHTGTTPPSSVDLEKLVNDKIDKIEVVTDNKDIYVVSIGDGWRPTLNEYWDDQKEIRDETDNDMLEQGLSNGWSPDELTYMCVREQLYRTGLRYGWTIEGGTL